MTGTVTTIGEFPKDKMVSVFYICTGYLQTFNITLQETLRYYNDNTVLEKWKQLYRSKAQFKKIEDIYHIEELSDVSLSN